MILGIGTDLCDIRRIERSIDKYGERFLDRIFTAHERSYCDGKSGKAAYYAKRFAAKEAAAKALARADTGSLSWQDVEVRNDPSGRPTLKLTGGALKRQNENAPKGHDARIHLSLTDDFPYAQAFVIIESIPSGDSA
ncbi:MAG: holo-ACP synthase [Alphaproteobacteria bacterium]